LGNFSPFGALITIILLAVIGERKYSKMQTVGGKEYNKLQTILLTVYTTDKSILEEGSIVYLSQLYYGPVVTYCMVYHYTKRATLARLLANEGPAIYAVF